MDKSVRVRYAPSPTGYQHIGGVRTALFNYLFARATGGAFILRIEDTDRERFQEYALKDIYNTFAWLGIKWDEGPDIGGPYGPYFQSMRKDIYKEYARQLIETGMAYKCYCSLERLDKIRKMQLSKKTDTGYDRHCRDLKEDERKEYERQGITPVIRLKVPLEPESSTIFYDELLGKIEKANKDINPDPVLLKSDGFPTYHLANVIDDHKMEITHILRSQEWIPSVPIHIILYKAFNWDPPKFCHLPMVMGNNGQKLSKRHGSTSIVDFKNQGYLPEALVNYIALLGWSYDDSREFFTLRELEACFSLNKLNKSPAIFDYKKLIWFNGMYIRKKSNEELQKEILIHLKDAGLITHPISSEQERIITGLIPIVRERLKFISEVAGLVCFLFKDVEIVDASDLIPKKLDMDKTLELMEKNGELLEGFESFSDEENERRFRDCAEELGIKLGDMLMPLRVAITASKVSPPLFESIRLLGMEKTRSRVKRAINLLKEVKN